MLLQPTSASARGNHKSVGPFQKEASKRDDEDDDDDDDDDDGLGLDLIAKVQAERVSLRASLTNTSND